MRLFPRWPGRKAWLARSQRVGDAGDLSRGSPAGQHQQDRERRQGPSNGRAAFCESLLVGRSKSTMTDATTAAGILAKAERIHSELATIVEQLRAIAETGVQVSQDDALPADLMRPGDVIHEFGIPRSTLHRLCRANPIGNADGFRVLRSSEAAIPNLTQQIRGVPSAPWDVLGRKSALVRRSGTSLE